MANVMSDSESTKILNQLFANQYRGPYSAKMNLRIENFFNVDTLTGVLDFNDENGERKVHLQNHQNPATVNWEYSSKNFGQEQWVHNESRERLYRIANRQWKKNTLGSLLSYEDWLKFPLDYLNSGSIESCEKTDNSYLFEIKIKASAQSLITHIQLECRKSPLQIQRITLFSGSRKTLKTFEILTYGEKDQKYFCKTWRVIDSDNLFINQIALSDIKFMEKKSAAATNRQSPFISWKFIKVDGVETPTVQENLPTE